MESYQPLLEKTVAMASTLVLQSTGTDSKLNLQPTGSSTSVESQDAPQEVDTTEKTNNESPHTHKKKKQRRVFAA